MKTLTLLTAILILASCNPCKRLMRKCPQSDSMSYVETVTLDTLTLISPADTFILRVPYDPVTLEELGFSARSTAAEVSLSVIEGILEVEAICPEDSLKAVIAQLESRSAKTIRIPYPVIEYKTRKIHKTALVFSIIVVLLAILYVVNRFKKFLPI